MHFHSEFLIVLVLLSSASSLEHEFADDFRSCVASFDLHEGKIIRTEESKKMGAKYLRAKDVTNKEDCMKFCCSTDFCDVFVLNEKMSNLQTGTCYLFTCGSADNFKCKFTKHQNYTSAVLNMSRRQGQLEEEIQYNERERELTNLRTNETDKDCNHTGSEDEGFSKDSTRSISEVKNSTKSSKCGPYQFECHSTGECIAIYNVCDGIPQCVDHSDEDVNGCLMNGGNPTKTGGKNMLGKYNLEQETKLHRFPNKNHKNEQIFMKENEDVVTRDGSNKLEQPPYYSQYEMNPWQKEMKDTYNIIKKPSSNIENYPSNMNDEQKPPYNRMNYGREGELMYQNNIRNGKNEDSRIYKQNYGQLHSFSQKQNDINAPFKYGDSATNQRMNPAYDGYNGYNNNYNGNGYYRQTNNNDFENGQHYKMGSQSTYEERMFPDSKISKSEFKKEYPEYYYEENKPKSSKIVQSTTSNHIMVNEKNDTAPVKKNKTEDIIPTTSRETATVSSATIRNEKEPKKAQQKEVAHHELEQQLNDEVLNDPEQYFSSDEMYGLTAQPTGAIVSLSIGIFVVALMILMVGCRLKFVRKRIRRGKLAHASDSDFLVNGMYL